MNMRELPTPNATTPNLAIGLLGVGSFVVAVACLTGATLVAQGAPRYKVDADWPARPQNNTIWILNRQDGTVLGRIGSTGNWAGQFHGLHMIATDSKGNIYTGEVQAGERVQKFVPAN